MDILKNTDILASCVTGYTFGSAVTTMAWEYVHGLDPTWAETSLRYQSDNGGLMGDKLLSQLVATAKLLVDYEADEVSITEQKAIVEIITANLILQRPKLASEGFKNASFFLSGQKMEAGKRTLKPIDVYVCDYLFKGTEGLDHMVKIRMITSCINVFNRMMNKRRESDLYEVRIHDTDDYSAWSEAFRYNGSFSSCMSWDRPEKGYPVGNDKTFRSYLAKFYGFEDNGLRLAVLYNKHKNKIVARAIVGVDEQGKKYYISKPDGRPAVYGDDYLTSWLDNAGYKARRYFHSGAFLVALVATDEDGEFKRDESASREGISSLSGYVNQFSSMLVREGVEFSPDIITVQDNMRVITSLEAIYLGTRATPVLRPYIDGDHRYAEFEPCEVFHKGDATICGMWTNFHTHREFEEFDSYDLQDSDAFYSVGVLQFSRFATQPLTQKAQSQLLQFWSGLVNLRGMTLYNYVNKFFDLVKADEGKFGR